MKDIKFTEDEKEAARYLYRFGATRDDIDMDNKGNIDFRCAKCKFLKVMRNRIEAVEEMTEERFIDIIRLYR